MSEPSTNIPGDVADAQVDATPADGPETAEKLELDLDEDKLEAWNEVKGDYQVDPDADTGTKDDSDSTPTED